MLFLDIFAIVIVRLKSVTFYAVHNALKIIVTLFIRQFNNSGTYI